MMISSEIIRHLIAETGMVSLPDDCDREISALFDEQLGHIEGSAFDLRLRSVSAAADKHSYPAIGMRERDIPKYLRIMPITSDTHRNPAIKRDYWFLERGKSYLLQSHECIKLPEYLGADVKTRTSMFRSGVHQACTRISPGYSGHITTAVHIPTYSPGVYIEYGARFCTVDFQLILSLKRFHQLLDLDVNSDRYSGIWSGDKTTTDGIERGY
jgi:deoxycytidine triphosphate deaminase